MKGRNVYILLGGAAAVFFFLRSRNISRRLDNVTRSTAAERDALARLLWAETSGIGSDQELAAIVNVALNRAKHPNYTILDVATPPGRSAAGVWNGAQQFRERWSSAPNYSSFAKTQRIVTGVLDGSIRNPIGTRTLFVHPGGLKRCARNADGLEVYEDGRPIGARRRCVDGRALPAWSVAQRDGGTAPQTPRVVGRGLFS